MTPTGAERNLTCSLPPSFPLRSVFPFPFPLFPFHPFSLRDSAAPSGNQSIELKQTASVRRHGATCFLQVFAGFCMLPVTKVSASCVMFLCLASRLNRGFHPAHVSTEFLLCRPTKDMALVQPPPIAVAEPRWRCNRTCALCMVVCRKLDVGVVLNHACIILPQYSPEEVPICRTCDAIVFGRRDATPRVMYQQ